MMGLTEEAFVLRNWTIGFAQQILPGHGLQPRQVLILQQLFKIQQIGH
jgi:hypothetical protein